MNINTEGKKISHTPIKGKLITAIKTVQNELFIASFSTNQITCVSIGNVVQYLGVTIYSERMSD